MTTVYSDFEDVIGDAVELNILDTQQAFDKERFKAKVRHFLKDHLDNVAIHKIHTNVPVTPTDLEELERILAEQNLYGDAEVDHIKTVGGLPQVVKTLVGLDKTTARKAFAGFIRENELNADQIEFVDMIINALSINGVVSPAQLYEQPFTLLNDRGLSGLFDAETSATIVALIKDLNQELAA